MKINIIIAFLGGIFAFFSPCILPVFPGFIAYLTGCTDPQNKNKLTLFIASLGYVLGFSLIFTLLGTSAGFIGQLLKDNIDILEKVSGIVIILLGIHLSGIIKITNLEKTKLFSLNINTRYLFINSFLLGMAFAIGWTPCIGPILASILLLSASSKTLWEGSLLLFIFSIGLGLPFILSALAMDLLEKQFNFISKNIKFFSYFAGFFLIIIGIMMLLGYLEVINITLMQIFNF